MSQITEEQNLKMRPFLLDEPEFNMKFYTGRVQHYFKIFNPMNSFYTNQQISEFQDQIKTHRALETETLKAGREVMLSEAEISRLRKVKTIVEASIHPDTGLPVPWIMRMCAFVPTNVPIIFGMLMAPPTPFNTALFQWLNQTYNAGMNYGNRNASSEQTTNDILFGYSAAVSSSIGISIALRRLSANTTKNLKGGKMVFANSIINYFAVASAGFLNTYCMRMGEMKRGIKIFDEMGEEIGVSKVTAESAVLQTSKSRLIMSFPTFFIPGSTMLILDRMGLIPKARGPKTVLDLFVVAIALSLACPLSVALFPSTGEIKASQLETEFRELKNSRGQVIEKFYYNKGL